MINVEKGISRMFNDRKIVQKVKEKLPKLFLIAEMESSRAGRIGMEVGSMREQILIALLVFVFGESNVDDEVPITKSEVDVNVFDNPISIKTVTGNGGIKAIWTVDSQKAREFFESYECSCDMLLAVIRWNEAKSGLDSGLFYVSKDIQKEVLENIGKEEYLKMPKAGTNPRGVEISRKAISAMTSHKGVLKIEIDWKKEKIAHKTYRRWLEMWKE